MRIEFIEVSLAGALMARFCASKIYEDRRGLRTHDPVLKIQVSSPDGAIYLSKNEFDGIREMMGW